ncbi:MAG: SDR family oxidoreductase [Anaerolineae bacterium]|nr:SDR family oxidoreductase [Anaerolineae bacterium]
MLLEGKNAIIYGAGGGIGPAVAKAFVREGAKVFLVGRTKAKLDKVAAEVKAAGGSAEVAVFDVLDEKAVEDHLRGVVATAGSVDISFNLVSRGDVQGIPLIDMKVEDYTRAVVNGLSAQFISARAAARQMSEQKSGVILMITSASSAGAVPMMGSTPAADAAMESFMRCFAAEVGANGIRVVGIWTAGVAETLTPANIAEVNSSMQLDEAGVQQIVQAISQMTMLKRPIVLSQVVETATFLASDRASGITGTIVNVTSGLVAVG